MIVFIRKILLVALFTQRAPPRWLALLFETVVLVANSSIAVSD